MAYSESLARSMIAISVSDSPDLGPLGMSGAHLQDATVELARHLLALGARIAYGGDLRTDGFTEILFELVARHRRDADEGDDRSGVVSYLAWPVHLSKSSHELVRHRNDLAGLATLLLLDKDGEPLDDRARAGVRLRTPSESEWSEGLTAMRGRMSADSHARIIAGGAVSGYMGAMPGIAEEALIALRDRRPLFVLGGFGGCAADIAETIGLKDRRGSPSRHWHGREAFRGVSPNDLGNGLDVAENCTLAGTPHVDEAVALILRGLLRIAPGASNGN